MQLVDLTIDDQRMPGIMPALKTRDHICPLAEPVDDLAFSLVTPLGADNNHVGHIRSFCAELSNPARIAGQQQQGNR